MLVMRGDASAVWFGFRLNSNVCLQVINHTNTTKHKQAFALFYNKYGLWVEQLKRLKNQLSSPTFTLSVEGGVAATDAAIVVVSRASLVNAAFLRGTQRETS